MYKKLLLFLLFVLLLGSSLRNLQATTETKDKELIIYTNKYLPMQGTINKMFYDKTGIMVSTISSSEADLLKKLGKKRFRDKADMVMGATLYEMAIIKESSYLAKIENSEINEIIPDGYKDKSGFLIPISLNPRVLVYNKYTLPRDTFNSYMDIFPLEYNIKTSQRTFANKYNRSLVAYLLKNYNEKDVKSWLENLSLNMLEKQKGNDRYSLRKVAKAESAYTFVNVSDLGLMLNSKDKEERKLSKTLQIKADYLKNNNLKQIKTEEESTKEYTKEILPIMINVFSVGILADAKNKDYAVEYIKFLLSEEIQNYIAQSSYEIPINKNANANKIYTFLEAGMIPKVINYEDIIFYNIKADNLIREIPNLLP